MSSSSGDWHIVLKPELRGGTRQEPMGLLSFVGSQVGVGLNAIDGLVARQLGKLKGVNLFEISLPRRGRQGSMREWLSRSGRSCVSDG